MEGPYQLTVLELLVLGMVILTEDCGCHVVIVEGSPTPLLRSRADPEAKAQDAQGME